MRHLHDYNKDIRFLFRLLLASARPTPGKTLLLKFLRAKETVVENFLRENGSKLIILS